MENTEMSDTVVVVIQPTTDDIENEGLAEHAEKTSSPPPSGSNGALQYDTMLQNKDKNKLTLLDVKPERQYNMKQDNISNITESLDVKSDVQHNYVSSFCQNKPDSRGYLLSDNIKTEHFAEDNNKQTTSRFAEQGLLIPLGIITSGAVRDNEPELQCNIGNIADSLHVKPNVQLDHMSSFGQSEQDGARYLYANDVMKTEQLVQDNNVSLYEVGSNVGVSYVEPEQCNIKQENVCKIEELSDIKPDVQPDFIPQCHLEDDERGYLCSYKCILKPKRSDITPESSTLEETWHTSEATGAIEKCIVVQPDFITSSNPDSTVESSSAVYVGDDVEEGLINNEQLSSQVTRHTHAGDKPFPCSHCDKHFSYKSDLLRHLKTHTGEKPHSCLHCDKRFSQKSNLTKHIRIHTGEKHDDPLPCPHCDELFSYKGRLLSHMKLHTGENPLPCPHCDKRFSYKSGLFIHMKTHTGEKQFSCPQCDKLFSQKGNLTKHIRMHTGEKRDKPFPCPHCDKLFGYKSGLFRHMKTHTGDKPVPCPHCDKRFTQKSSLSRHMERHTKEKLFSCPHCDKRFSQKYNLAAHIRTHTGEKRDKSLPCPHCEKLFSYESELDSHMRKHTGEKPFCCLLCDKHFSHKSDLLRHLKTHTGEKPFSCPHCDKRFTQKSSLSTHMKTHTREKPFSCPHCDKRCRDKSDLRTHMRTHTGEKPHPCPHCDKPFSHKSYLATHIRTHTC